jgi:uncharacterized protein YndB with AHSA1/START domain
MTGFADRLDDTERELRGHGDGLATLAVRRRYAAVPEAVWDAITDPVRLARWFLPVSGDLRPGGRFALEGNAEGDIVRCEPPRELALSWEAGGGRSDVVVRLAPERGDATILELEHSPVPPEIVPNASPEAWGLGAGWEIGFVYLVDELARRIPDGRAIDREAAASREDLAAIGRLGAAIGEQWARVLERSGLGQPRT